MKLLILLFSILFSSGQVLAERIKTKVHSIVSGQKQDIVRFQNGRVAFIDPHDNELKRLIINAKAIEVDINDKNKLLSALSITPSTQQGPISKTIEERPPYTPTILSSFSEAEQMFERLNPDYKRVSQCYNRAHIWAYEEFNKNQIHSMKTFVFFTASYIERNGFNWWFHVAPMVYVQENNRPVEYVLDYRYAHSPLRIKEWTDMFVFNKRPCKITTKFSEYDVNPQTEECYLINTTMYYWQPQDIHNQELQNRYKSSFENFDVKASYQEAF